MIEIPAIQEAITMMALPKDMTDLFLAPVVLTVERRIQELGALSVNELADRVALEADVDVANPAGRLDGLLRTIGYLQELHDWSLAWDERGIRLTHGAHTVVLGVPQVFRDFLAAVAPGSNITLADLRAH